MKAAVWHKAEDLRVEELPEPSPAPGQLKLKVTRVGICGTDLHEYLKGPIFIPTTPHPLTGMQAPVALGHEFCGEVVAVGKGVTGITEGTRVAVDACICCGTCWYCRRGAFPLCDQVGFTGLAAHGGMAEYAVIPAYAAYPLPDTVSDDQGALVEPISVAVHAMRKAELQPGDTVAVLGAGPIGLVTAMAARTFGAARVFVVEKAKARMEQAKALGATAVIDPAAGDPVDQLRGLTQGRGADIVFECIGHKDTAPLAVEMARKGGKAVIVGIFEEPSVLSFNSLVFGEKQIRSAIGYTGEFSTTIQLIADGRLRPQQLITGRIGLDDVVEKGFLELIHHKDRHVKILIDPQG
ncbi:MAG: 2,3-butanediol dehydrogenase [Thermodesulfobacteriota bacterium]|jgi:(R,R)-butanediol dehydrogenase/meso-butanediol dehydrogenase/diacetyl reductase